MSDEIKKEWVLGVDEDLIKLMGQVKELEESYAGQFHEINCLEQRCDDMKGAISKLQEGKVKSDEWCEGLEAEQARFWRSIQLQESRLRFLEECLIKAGLG
jgi:hypothetical protein